MLIYMSITHQKLSGCVLENTCTKEPIKCMEMQIKGKKSHATSHMGGLWTGCLFVGFW